MKIALALFFSLVLALPTTIHAEEHTFPDPMEQMQQLLQCVAVNMTLSHLHSQIAASMSALSGPEGQALNKSMIDGYQKLAKADKDKNDYISKVIKEAVVPQLLGAGMPKDVVREGSSKVIGKSLMDMAVTLGNPKHEFDDQVGMEQALVDQSGQCDTFASKVLQSNTF